MDWNESEKSEIWYPEYEQEKERKEKGTSINSDRPKEKED